MSDTLLKQIKAVCDGEENLVANLSNITAILQDHYKEHWIGFYLVDKTNNNLVLGPFQGPLACTRIPFGKGVCGTAWKEMKTQIVDDVHKFEGHIACSSLTNSEIVVPIIKNDECFGVIDIDSKDFSKFGLNDQKSLESIADFISSLF